MGTRAIKQHVLDLLKQDDLAALETELALLQEKEVINALFLESVMHMSKSAGMLFP